MMPAVHGVIISPAVRVTLPASVLNGPGGVLLARGVRFPGATTLVTRAAVYAADHLGVPSDAVILTDITDLDDGSARYTFARRDDS